MLGLLIFVGLVAVVAASGAVFMPGQWYQGLNKPKWTPPNWLFAPAWTILYVMIAVAGWLIWKAEGVGPALVIWAANLFFNGIWSWLMFGCHRMGTALVDAILMLLTILGFIILAWPSSQTAALLFVPYLGWVMFATALNAALFVRNPSPA